MRTDCSIPRHVPDDDVILITDDRGNCDGYIEDIMRCARLGHDPSVDDIILAVRNLEDP